MARRRGAGRNAAARKTIGVAEILRLGYDGSSLQKKNKILSQFKISAEPPLHGEVSKTYKKTYGTMADNHIYICIQFNISLPSHIHPPPPPPPPLYSSTTTTTTTTTTYYYYHHNHLLYYYYHHHNHLLLLLYRTLLLLKHTTTATLLLTYGVGGWEGVKASGSAEARRGQGEDGHSGRGHAEDDWGRAETHVEMSWFVSMWRCPGL